MVLQDLARFGFMDGNHVTTNWFGSALQSGQKLSHPLKIPLLKGKEGETRAVMNTTAVVKPSGVVVTGLGNADQNPFGLRAYFHRTWHHQAA
jgi:hypothetical protein